jgi:hypothetical protein
MSAPEQLCNLGMKRALPPSTWKIMPDSDLHGVKDVSGKPWLAIEWMLDALSKTREKDLRRYRAAPGRCGSRLVPIIRF